MSDIVLLAAYIAAWAVTLWLAGAAHRLLARQHREIARLANQLRDCQQREKARQAWAATGWRPPVPEDWRQPQPGTPLGDGERP